MAQELIESPFSSGAGDKDLPVDGADVCLNKYIGVYNGEQGKGSYLFKVFRDAGYVGQRARDVVKTIEGTLLPMEFMKAADPQGFDDPVVGARPMIGVKYEDPGEIYEVWGAKDEAGEYQEYINMPVSGLGQWTRKNLARKQDDRGEYYFSGLPPKSEPVKTHAVLSSLQDIAKRTGLPVYLSFDYAGVEKSLVCSAERVVAFEGSIGRRAEQKISEELGLKVHHLAKGSSAKLGDMVKIAQDGIEPLQHKKEIEIRYGVTQSTPSGP
jgi:hypothetical protein